MPNKWSAYGSLDHILSSCTSSDDALLKWTLVKRKMIIHKIGTPGGTARAHAALLSDVPSDDTEVMRTMYECTDEYDDSEVSVPFTSVAFSFSLAPGRNLPKFRVIDSACYIRTHLGKIKAHNHSLGSDLADTLANQVPDGHRPDTTYTTG
jgi:hypothetical protein